MMIYPIDRLLQSGLYQINTSPLYHFIWVMELKKEKYFLYMNSTSGLIEPLHFDSWVGYNCTLINNTVSVNAKIKESVK